MSHTSDRDIKIELLRKETQTPISFEFPKCARCTNACKNCRIAFLMNKIAEQRGIETPETIAAL